MWETIRRSGSLLASIPLGSVLVLLGLCGLAILGAALRWQVILRGLGLPIRLRELVLLNLAATCTSNLTPGRVGGEVLRLALLCRRTQVDARRATVSIVCDRLVEAAQLPLFCLLVLPFLPLRTLMQRLDLRAVRWPRLSEQSLIWLLVAIALLVTLSVLVRRSARLSSQLRSALATFRSVRIPRRQLFGSALYAQSVWLVDALRLFVAAHAVGVPLLPWQAMVLSISTVTESLIPTLGGIGVVEGTLVAVLCLYGVSADHALATALVDRVVSYGLVTAAGAVALVLLGVRTPRAALTLTPPATIADASSK